MKFLMDGRDTDTNTAKRNKCEDRGHADLLIRGNPTSESCKPVSVGNHYRGG
jgi:hypothetical protein